MSKALFVYSCARQGTHFRLTTRSESLRSLWVNCCPKGTLWMASCCANRLVTGGKASTALNELRDSFNGAATGQMANATYRYEHGVWYMGIICPTTLAKMSGSRCDWECNFETLSADTLALYTNTTHTHTQTSTFALSLNNNGTSKTTTERSIFLSCHSLVSGLLPWIVLIANTALYLALY